VTDTPRGPEALAELARCRDEIEQIDRQIIALLSRRLTLGRRTGELKRLAGLPILDPSREAAVIRRVTGEARDAGLPPEPIREVFWQIVGMSRRAQESGDAAGDDLMSGGDQL
jgi:chorismate mutase